MATLLNISDDLLALEALMAEAAAGDGDITEVEQIVTEWFAQIQDNLEQKVDNYVQLIREMELRAAARQEEAERLLHRVKADARNADWLKSRLKQFMETHNMKKLETRRFTVSVATNGGKLPLVVDVPPEQLPKEFQKVRIEVTADNDAIRQALDNGQELPFARYGPRGTRLAIR